MARNKEGIYRFVCSECNEDVLEENPDYHLNHDCPYCFHKLLPTVEIPDNTGLLAGRCPARRGLVGAID
jgi:DNA-directed RNA polymerase subunit RPC12/RpoP